MAGTGWSIVKWWLYVTRQREKYEEVKTDFLQSKAAPGAKIPDKAREKWAEMVRARTAYGFEFRPRAREHKADILFWMTYWPWSGFWTLLNDPIRRLFRAIYHRITGILQRISDHAFKGTENDIAVETKEKPEDLQD